MRVPVSQSLDDVIEDLPRRYPGPGGAVCVVKDGVAVVRHAWGFADLERRIHYTPATLAPICSITKQFTCATLLSVAPDPSILDGVIAASLPRLEGERPSTLDLANNQSGLRDYWALTVLAGAMPEGVFTLADANALVRLTSSLHFRPGTAYSYSNGNFRMLAAAIAERSGRDFGELLIDRIAGPAAMNTAVFQADTGAVPGGAMGYEGTMATGWRPGVNRIHWCGDAGLHASLDDMIAWEQFIDRTRDDPDGVYGRLSAPVTYRDGSPASYGLGLSRKTVWGRAMTRHGGAIRGWRLQRLHVASERLSVAVAFNHESDSKGAAMRVLASALGEAEPTTTPVPGSTSFFEGHWLDQDTGLLLEVVRESSGALRTVYGGVADSLAIGHDGVARGSDMALAPDGTMLAITRAADAIRSRAARLSGPAATDVAGTYHSPELEADMEVVDAGGSWFAGFSGPLGDGPLMPLTPAAGDVWRLACHRSLDAPAPGEWTVQVRRDPGGAVRSLSVGCLLARTVVFERR